MAAAPAMLPIPLLSAGTTTSIHLHPAGIFEQGNLIFPFTALTPTVGVDDRVFSQYSTNIIVGRIEVVNGLNVTKNSDGSFI